MRYYLSLGALSVTSALAFGALSLGLGAANAHRPHQANTPYPFRCPQQGVCLQSTGGSSLFGGVRQGDSEMRFHAVHKSDIGGADGQSASSASNEQDEANASDANSQTAGENQSDDGEWCVMLTTMAGETVVASSGGSQCDAIDLNDGTLFGVKPTIEEEDERNLNGLQDGSHKSLLQHILNSQPHPEHPAAWQEVVKLATEQLNGSDDSKDSKGKDSKDAADKYSDSADSALSTGDSSGDASSTGGQGSDANDSTAARDASNASEASATNAQ